MRLWHKDIVEYLPRQQLLGQWRELNLIYREIKVNGRVNHILVNYVNDDIESFYAYTNIVLNALTMRGYKVKPNELVENARQYLKSENIKIPFEEIHNDRYLRQCLLNLQEKYDRGGITEKEWYYVFQNLPRNIKIYDFMDFHR